MEKYSKYCAWQYIVRGPCVGIYYMYHTDITMKRLSDYGLAVKALASLPEGQGSNLDPDALLVVAKWIIVQHE